MLLSHPKLIANPLLKHCDGLFGMPILQECGSLAAKLLRTYTAQVEVLARLRRGCEQRVIVQHVHINEGGQAIVGAVNHPGGGKK
jgi:hypothetical protein